MRMVFVPRHQLRKVSKVSKKIKNIFLRGSFVKQGCNRCVGTGFSSRRRGRQIEMTKNPIIFLNNTALLGFIKKKKYLSIIFSMKKKIIFTQDL